MVQKILCIFSPLFFLYGSLYAEQRQGSTQLHGELETTLALERRAQEKRYTFDFPLYGNIYLAYVGEEVRSVISLDYVDEAALGDMYIMGGGDYSYLKLGYYTEDWGRGYSASVVDKLNRRDSRYPGNIFYRNRMAPNPMFTLSFGEGSLYEQVALSHRDGTVERLEDALLGLRTLYVQSGYDIGLGIIRYIGYPPPLLFITAYRETSQYSVWSELGWWHHGEQDDRLNAVLGMENIFSAASVVLEFIVEASRVFLFIEEDLQLNNRIGFNMRGFVYLKTFSSALNGFFTLAVDESTDVELGAYLFFGKRGSYFSRFEHDRDNSVYLRLHFEF